MLNILLYTGYFLGFIVLTSTLLSMTPLKNWWARVCDFVPLQVLIISLVSLAMFAFAEGLPDKVSGYLYTAALVAVLIRNLVIIYPYTAFHTFDSLPSSKGISKDSSISIVYCNVLMANRQNEKLLSVVRSCDPDMLLFAETDEWWRSKLEVLKKDYPFYKELPKENTYGMIFYSRLEFEDEGFRYLVEKDVPSLFPVVTLKDGNRIQCCFIHPRPPVPGESDDSVPRDKELLIVSEIARKSRLPVIVAGDMNDVGWSPSSRLFRKNSMLLDPRIGRGLFATFNAKFPLFRWPLDHIFHSAEFRVRKIRKLGHTGSDHFPIYVKLTYEPDKAGGQQHPAPDADDKKEAEKKLNGD